MVNFLWENFFRRDPVNTELRKLLAQTYIFETLSGMELRFLKDMVHIRDYRPGEVVFKQGELGVGMYILMKGQVDISVETPDIVEGELRSIFVTRLEKGDFFGEIALIEERGRRTATAVAADETRLVGFFKPDLDEIVSRNPATGIKIMTRLCEVLGRRLKETSNKVTELKRELRSTPK